MHLCSFAVIVVFEEDLHGTRSSGLMSLRYHHDK